MKRVFILSDRLPSRAGAGAESHLFYLCKKLVERGSRLNYLLAHHSVERGSIVDTVANCTLGIEYGVLVSSKNKEGILQIDSLERNSKISEIVVRDCDSILVFNDTNIVEMQYLNIGKKVAWPDDPPFMALLMKASCCRLTKSSRIKSLIGAALGYSRNRVLVKSLRSYDAVLHHSSKHALEFQRWTKRRVIHVPSPISNDLDDIQKIDYQKKGSLSACHIGHLGGAASLLSLNMLMKRDYINAFQQNKVTLRFFGRCDIPEHLLGQIKKRGFIVKGFANDVDMAIMRSDVLVVAGNYTVGSRTRILHALSLGVPVICHRTALAGLPFLHTQKGVYIFDGPKDFSCLLGHMSSLSKEEMLELRKETFRDYREASSKFSNVWCSQIVSLA